MTRFPFRRRYGWKSLISVVIIALIGAIGGLRREAPDAVFNGPFHAVDGDTLSIGGLRMRLRGIDAPEMKQRCGGGDSQWACGVSARKALQAMAATDAVCSAHGTDKYRRRLVRCTLGGKDVGATLVRGGFAVAYGDYTHEEAEARAERRGIWSGPFERPEDWRKAHRTLSPAEERQEQRASLFDDD